MSQTIVSNYKVILGKSRKNCGKRRKCWLLAFSPFPTFSIFQKLFTNRNCLVNGLYEPYGSEVTKLKR